MNNLQIFNTEVIPVYTTDEGNKVVLGRELHEKLSITTRYADWFKRMCEYGFSDGTDFSVFLKNEKNPSGGRPNIDHIMTLDMAKHISMIQRTPQGMAIRQKLIDLEKESLLLKQNQQNTLEGLSPQLQYLIRLEQAQNRQAKEIAQVNERLDAACEAFSLTAGADWKKVCSNAISAIAMKRGGGSDAFEDVWNEIYAAVDSRGFRLEQRVANMQKNAMQRGSSKSAIRKISKLDAIELSGNRTLICAFVDAVRETAAAQGIRTKKLDELQQTSLFDRTCAPAGKLVEA